MVSFFTLIPLMFSYSQAQNNDLYPTYRYCVSLESDGYIPSQQYVVYRTNASSSTIFYSDFNYHVDGLLYFNDSTEFYIDDLTFTLDINFYSYDYTNDVYVDEDTLNIPLISLDYYSSSDGTLAISNTFKIYKGSLPFGLYLDVTTPLGNTTTRYYTFNGGYTMPNNQNPISFRFEGDNVLSSLLTLMNNYVSNGYALGFNDGYNSGYQNGYEDGNSTGYQNGYQTGYTEASTQNQTAVTIFSGIISIALIPINFFLACLNFEVFGINIGSFVSALLTVAIVVIITRMILSGGNGGGDK